MSLGLSLSNLPFLANSTGYLPVEDTFDRPNGIINKVGDIYSTSSYITDGRAAWDVLTGNFCIYNNKLIAGASAGTLIPSSSAIATIDNRSSNVYISADISSTGGDGIYFRVTDASNWYRVYLKSDVETTTTPVGYYTYEWESSASVSNYVSIYKDTKKYFPSQTACRDTNHDHSVISTVYNAQISEFDPLHLKWGKYPYQMVKRGIRYRDGNVIVRSQGDDVKYLQGVLRHYYNDNQMAIDGDFGPYTEQQLKRLQTEYKLIVDGYAWNLQSWLVVDRLAISAIEMGTNVEEERTQYLRRYLLGNTYNFPTKLVTGTSTYQPPEDAYSDIVHTHEVLLNSCRKLSTVGSHVHYAINNLTGASAFVSTGDPIVTTNTTYSVIVEQSIDGTVTEVPMTLMNGYSQGMSDIITSLQIILYDNYLSISTSGSSARHLVSYGVVNNGATRHGVGRGPTDTAGTAIDNYKCVPIDAMIIPSEV